MNLEIWHKETPGNPEEIILRNILRVKVNEHSVLWPREENRLGVYIGSGINIEQQYPIVDTCSLNCTDATVSGAILWLRLLHDLN